MVEIKLNDEFKVKLYESADEMPMDLYFLNGQYAILDYEAGSTPADVDKRFQRLDMHMVNKRWEEMIQERQNMHQTFYNIVQRVHFPSLQFGCHIHSVNDKLIDDRSQKNLIKIMEQMGQAGFTYRDLMQTLEGIKKKMMHELRLLFPDKYTDTAKQNYLEQIRRKVIAELNFIVTAEEKFLNEVRGVYDYFVSLMTPRNISWTDSGNVVIESKLAYEKLCMFLTQDGIPTPGQLSVVKFHIAVQVYESKRRPKSK